MKSLAYALTGLLVFTTHAIAADCVALKAMSEEPKELIEKRDNIQRSEWLLLEYLSSERSARKTFENEVEQSQRRVKELLDQTQALAALAELQPPPQQGTPECAKFERYKVDVEKLVSDREKALAAYHKKFGFLYSCEELARYLLTHNRIATAPDATPQRIRTSVLALEIGTGPFQMSARVTGAHMAEMIQQSEERLELAPRQRYAYFALSCLKRYQKQERSLRSLSEIHQQLKACPTNNWTQTGICVAAAALKM